MSDVGLEPTPLTVSKTPISEGGGAKFDSHDAPKAPKDPDLDVKDMTGTAGVYQRGYQGTHSNSE